MAGMPGILIRIGAETRDAIQGINKVERAIGQSLGPRGRVTSLLRSAGPALAAGVTAAAAGIAAVSIDAAKAASQDQDAQARLARTLRNTLGATEGVTSAVEQYIDKASKLTGITDDELRPGFERLIRSTRNVGKAEKLNNLAMRISLQTGKSYGSVVQALARANDGTVTSLKRLGITIGPQARNFAELTAAQKAQAKAEDEAARVRETAGPKSDAYAKAIAKVAAAGAKVAQINGAGVDWIAELNGQFSGAIATDAGTYAGKIRRINTAIGELEESFGKGVLDGITSVTDQIGTFDEKLYDMQGDAEVVGKAIGTLAVDVLGYAADFARGLQAIPTAWNDWINTISGGVTNVREWLGNIPFAGGNPLAIDSTTAAAMRRAQDAQHARNLAAYNAIVNPPGTALTASRLDTYSASESYNQSRYNTRAADATGRGDARGAQRNARTRQRP